MDLTDAQWAFLEPLFRPKRREDGRGRPWQDARAVLNGVFWVLRTGAPWHDLPRRYPPYQILSSPLPTVAAFRAAHPTAPETGGRLTRPGKAGSERIVHRCQLQFGEKRGSAVGPTRRGKGSKIMAISDGHGLPIAVHVASASPHETKLVEPTIEQRFLAETPQRLIGDRAYDSDRLDAQMRERFGVQLVAPNKSTRSQTPRQDGRVLRRYRRRWKIERLFAWLHNFRRVVIRWEYYPENFLGMVQLACAVILLRYL